MVPQPSCSALYHIVVDRGSYRSPPEAPHGRSARGYRTGAAPQALPSAHTPQRWEPARLGASSVHTSYGLLSTTCVFSAVAPYKDPSQKPCPAKTPAWLRVNSSMPCVCLCHTTPLGSYGGSITKTPPGCHPLQSHQV